jgi:hypothetical protein
MTTQLDLGDLWEPCDLITCSCAARGPVLVHDRKLAAGLTERTSRCKGCDAVLTWRIAAPQLAPKPARPAPLLHSMRG